MSAYEDFGAPSTPEWPRCWEPRSAQPGPVWEPVKVDAGPGVGLWGELIVPERPAGVVAFAQGSGGSRSASRAPQLLADRLVRDGSASLLFDLLAPGEDRGRGNVFDLPHDRRDAYRGAASFTSSATG